MPSIYLASNSPRRRELLTLLALSFECLSVNVLEQRQLGESPQQYVTRLAQEKAQAGVAIAYDDRPVLGADTVVLLGGTVLEKPKNPSYAAAMLRRLSGQQHQVITGIALANRQHCLSSSVVTEVCFRVLTEQEIYDYVQTGEPMDKAGAYAIQGMGGRFIRFIRGSYHNVVGLPLVETEELLQKFVQSKPGGVSA